MNSKTLNQAMVSKLIRAHSAVVGKTASLNNIPSVALGVSDRRYELENVRKIANMLFANSKRPIKQKTNVFYNFKGGTGKTSLCYQVATHLALMGFDVLALDLDPQAHLSLAMQIPEDYSGPTIYDVMINGHDLEDSLTSIFPGLDLLPANISMTRIEVPLSTKTKREEKLAQILNPLKSKYDYIIIDTNPTISTLNLNALFASDRINIVCETQPFSLAGLRILVSEISHFFREMTKTDPNYCIIPNKYEIKTAISQEVLGLLRTEYSDKVIGSVVRKSEEFNTASKIKSPISFFCRSRSVAFEDVMDLIHELIDQTASKKSDVSKVA